MVKMNDMMKAILKDENGEESNLQLDNILTKIVNKTKKIKDCIIYDQNDTLEEEKINFNRIIQFVGDWTGYEVSCNELRFERKSIPQSQFEVLASRLSDMLSQKFNGKEIVVYILLCDNEIELRFHTHRENERLWLDKDLNKYDNPILCWV
ncbi:MAG: hypothetical protein E7265_10065 [Lachnospiraceae bacterium]|nr:hypothetical protein [Lachnospiraceae bacterium]